MLLAHVGAEGLLSRDLVALASRLGVCSSALDGALRALQRGSLLARIAEGEQIRFMRPECVVRPTDLKPGQNAKPEKIAPPPPVRPRRPGVPQPPGPRPLGQLWCNWTGHWASITAFGPRKTTRGYDVWCRKCKAAQMKAARDARKAKA
jgi:hypothetical protein